MRRKDRERDAAFAWAVLQNCEYATLSTVNAGGTPYGVPVSPVVLDGAVYFHCAPAGQKLDNIRRQPHVSLSAVGRTRLIPQQFTTAYESDVVTGTCCELTRDQEKFKYCGPFAKKKIRRLKPWRL